MPSEPKRKLAAIMFTDMVGYTSLMQKDEVQARELVQNHREIIKPLIEKHAGEVIQYVGDGTFSTFGSAIEAVNCAAEIQRHLLDVKGISVRIGLHVGDVVVEGEEVYGDGVNVASRLEPLAEPGGIFISGRVYDDIRNQPGIEAKFLGEKSLKNVDHPVKIYSLIGEGLEAAKPFEEEEKAVIESKEVGETISKSASKKLLPWAAGAAMMVLLIVVLWNLPFFSSGDRILEASGEIRSIAVLPLDNMSNDPDQEYFSDGMTEALISDIAKIRSLKVISRTSVMRYKGTDKSLPEIARELKVDAILEGSVMHAEGEVRITIQLIRASTDEHLWADSYTDKLENIMILQSRIARAVAEEIKLTLSPEEEINIGGERKVNPEAYKLYLQALKIDPWVESFEAQEEAINLLQKGVEIDEDFIDGWILISDKVSMFQFQKRDNDRERIIKAKQALDKAKELDPTMIEVQLSEGHYHYYGNKDYINGLESYYRVLRNDPNNSVALEHVGYVLRRMGKWVASLDKLLEVYKRDPYNADLVRSIADTYFNLRNFTQSEVFFKKALDISPKFIHPYIGLADIAFQKSGNPEDALAAMATDIKVIELEWYLGVKSYFLSLSGNLDAAIEEINTVPTADFQLGPLVNSREFYLGVAHKIVGENSKADDYFNSIVPDLEIAHRLEPKNNQWMLLLSFSYAYLDRKEEAISIALRRVENVSISDDAYWGVGNEQALAEIYTMTGDYDKALDIIERLLSIPSWMSIESLRAWPVWKPLHDLPRYTEIMKKYGADA